MSLYQVINISKVIENKTAQFSSPWVISQMDRTDVFIDIGNDPKELCNRLKELGFLESADMRKVSVSSMDKDLIEVRGKKSFKPICRLEIARWMTHQHRL